MSSKKKLYDSTLLSAQLDSVDKTISMMDKTRGEDDLGLLQVLVLLLIRFSRYLFNKAFRDEIAG